MLAAVIGIGSNSVRALVARNNEGVFERLFRDREGTRLFAGLDSRGMLKKESILKTAEAEGFLNEAQQSAGTAKRLKVFMDRYGYRDAGGWWIKKGSGNNRFAATRDTGTIVSRRQDPEDNG